MKPLRWLIIISNETLPKNEIERIFGGNKTSCELLNPQLVPVNF